MRVAFAPFWLHKDGVEPREYEDAFAPAWVDDRPWSSLRCAVADGATESAYSRVWARQLVSEFVSGGLTGPDLAELPLVGQRWARSVSSSISRNDAGAWYLERKAEDGAFAALIGLEFLTMPGREDAGTFDAIALGDSCFFQVRGDAVERAFPLADSAAFSARPVLLPSRPVRADEFAGSIARCAGTWRSGDAFFMMTDALACWFVAAVERGERPWREIGFARRDRAGFRRWVRALRPDALKNDDVTLLRITVC